MTSLTFYGGVKEIGGNKILLEDKKTKIFLDFGMSFGLVGEFYDNFLGPKKCNGLNDYLELGIVPEFKGIYRQDYLRKMGRPEEEKSIDGVLISHAHVDHIGMLNLLRADIPIYCSTASKCIMQMIDDTSPTSEYTKQKKAFQFYTNSKGGISRMDSRHQDGVVQREINEIDKPFEIGELKITPFSVDHSLPGALAFAIETSSGVVVYSGDLRFHGRNTAQSLKFADEVAKYDPVAFIVEGTRIDAEKTETEEDVYKAVKDVINNKGLTIVNYPVRDTDRMQSILKAAQDNNEQLAVNTKQAHLLSLFEENEVDAPKLKDMDIYISRKSWGLLTEKDVPEGQLEQDYDLWERDFLNAKNAVNCEDIRKNQKEYVWHCDFFELKELMDVKPIQGSHFIWSLTEPFNIKMELDKELIDNWLAHFNIPKIIEKHVSGHACGPELKDILNDIQPKMVFPIHTEKPGKFRDISSKVKLVEKGKRYDI